MSGYFLERLADFCAKTTYDALPPGTIHEVKRAVLDCLGCALGAYRIGANRDLIPVICGLGGPAEATIWGDGSRVPAPYAALAVGTIAAHLEYSAHSDVIPAAFAVAEARHSDGQALIAALAAAFGVTAALKQLLASGIEAHGLHWPGQLLATASTAAACKLEQTTVDQMASALSLAGCLAPIAPFEAFTKGARAKDLYGGWGGMLGVLAARLSRVGFAGPASPFEGVRGLGRAWLHTPPSPQDLRSALAAARSDVSLQLRFKPFASCVSAHPALSALEIVCSRIKDVRGQPDLDVGDIARVEVSTYTYAAELSSESTGQTPVSARVNIPYLCAALLLDGVVGGEQAEEPRRSDPRLHDMAAKVSVIELPGTGAELSARSRPASVAVIMRDGERFEASVSGPKWEQDAPPSDAELEHKFHSLVGNLIPPARCETLVRTLWQLETVTDVGDVVAYLV